MIENPDRTAATGVAAATLRARAAAFTACVAAIREGQAGAGAAVHDQARAIADRTSLLPALAPKGTDGGEGLGLDWGPNLAEEVEVDGEANLVDAAEGAFAISAEAEEVADFVEIDIIEIII